MIEYNFYGLFLKITIECRSLRGAELQRPTSGLLVKNRFAGELKQENVAKVLNSSDKEPFQFSRKCPPLSGPQSVLLLAEKTII